VAADFSAGSTDDEDAAATPAWSSSSTPHARQWRWDDQRPQLRRAHPRQGLEVIHHDHHPIGRPGFRINTA
jgi:hypothetical protein